MVFKDACHDKALRAASLEAGILTHAKVPSVSALVAQMGSAKGCRAWADKPRVMKRRDYRHAASFCGVQDRRRQQREKSMNVNDVRFLLLNEFTYAFIMLKRP